MATRVAGNVLKERSKYWLRGERKDLKELLLTPHNIQKITEQLSHLRGAAMKLGQLLSMDAGSIIPEELSLIMSRLRNQAQSMPIGQIGRILNDQWGANWQENFKHFDFTPIAAASIGQVHQATLKAGDQVAIKIQYPGIRKSIDSDVNNVATLLKISGLLPKDFKLKPLLEEAKKQLHKEANYQLEAQHLSEFSKKLTHYDHFCVPKVFTHLTTEKILTMSYEAGDDIENSIDNTLSNHITKRLFELLFIELFTIQAVQTDPNFANYKYNPATKKVVLLDFGATRRYSKEFSDNYKELLLAGIQNNLPDMSTAAKRLGYFSETITKEQKNKVLELFAMAFEPLQSPDSYDFGDSKIAENISEAGTALSLQYNYWHTPPADALFLHRKLAGLFLLAKKHRAKINIKEILMQHLDN
ncbi:MAG: AarF/ABC1/UbiB kinase family protein [Gammaproteobacteria bacterium]|nr:AarF/ABC1/UbiB kinase family protein [Gammaproteobacteria bacterium]